MRALRSFFFSWLAVAHAASLDATTVTITASPGTSTASSDPITITVTATALPTSQGASTGDTTLKTSPQSVPDPTTITVTATASPTSQAGASTSDTTPKTSPQSAPNPTTITVTATASPTSQAGASTSDTTLKTSSQSAPDPTTITVTATASPPSAATTPSPQTVTVTAPDPAPTTSKTTLAPPPTVTVTAFLSPQTSAAITSPPQTVTVTAIAPPTTVTVTASTSTWRYPFNTPGRKGIKCIFSNQSYRLGPIYDDPPPEINATELFTIIGRGFRFHTNYDNGADDALDQLLTQTTCNGIMTGGAGLRPPSDEDLKEGWQWLIPVTAPVGILSDAEKVLCLEYAVRKGGLMGWDFKCQGFGPKGTGRGREGGPESDRWEDGEVRGPTGRRHGPGRTSSASSSRSAGG